MFKPILGVTELLNSLSPKISNTHHKMMRTDHPKGLWVMSENRFSRQRERKEYLAKLYFIIFK